MQDVRIEMLAEKNSGCETSGLGRTLAGWNSGCEASGWNGGGGRIQDVRRLGGMSAEKNSECETSGEGGTLAEIEFRM